MTISLSLASVIFGTILGACIWFLYMRKNPFASAFASLYIRIFRALPVVVLLLVLNYIVFRNSGLTVFRICTITFAIEFSAYCAEIFRSGINAVPEGQSRAAKALGFGKMKTFFKVVWPQAVVHILPVYSGQIIATVKQTSVAGYISLVDLTKASDIIRSRTYEAFFPLFLTSVVYFLICYIVVRLLRILEKKADPEKRKIRQDILEIVNGFDLNGADADFTRSKAEAAETEMPLIRIEHLRKSFGNVTPIRDLSCDIRRGDVVSIIGQSGSGKTTLLNLITHLEKADGESILFEGQDTFAKGYNLNRMREQIGMLFQSFNLFAHLTIVENLMLAQTELQGRSREEACRRSMQLLRMVGMTDKALNLPKQLSGGQQQRAAIIRAVAMDPKIILLDEPTSALDPAMIGEVLEVIRKLARDGLTMLIVTHEMNFARDVSNRVFFLDEGVIYEEGTPQEIFTAPKKDKTSQFIHRLHVFETRIRRQDLEPMNIIIQIEQFGCHHMIARQMINKMLTITEELCLQILIPQMKEMDELRLRFEYSDAGGGKISLYIACPGENRDPLQEADEVSTALIRHACRDLSWQFSGGMCSIKGTIGQG